MSGRSWVYLKPEYFGGALVVQLVKRPTFDFGSGRDPGAVGSSPLSGFSLGAQQGVCWRFSLSLSPYPLLPL